MLKMFQLLWVFFAQLLAQTVEIYPSENFRYIAVVNGTKSYGIIFGAADPDLDTTGFTYLIRDELHPTFNTTMAFLLLGHTENSIGFTDEYRGIVRDADGNVFLNKTAIIAPSYGVFRDTNRDNYAAGLLSWVPESTINLGNGVFEYSSMELSGVYETTIPCNNGTTLCYCHFDGDPLRLTFYVDGSTDLQVSTQSYSSRSSLSESLTKTGLERASSANIDISLQNNANISTVTVDYRSIQFSGNEEAQLNVYAEAWQMGEFHPMLAQYGISFDHIESVYRCWSVISFERIENLEISFNSAKSYFVDETVDFWLTMENTQTLSSLSYTVTWFFEGREAADVRFNRVENRYRFSSPGQYQVFVELELDDIPEIVLSATAQVIILERFTDFNVELENIGGELVRMVETGETFFFRVSNLNGNTLKVDGGTLLSQTFSDGDELRLTAPGNAGTFSLDFSLLSQVNEEIVAVAPRIELTVIKPTFLLPFTIASRVVTNARTELYVVGNFQQFANWNERFELVWDLGNGDEAVGDTVDVYFPRVGTFNISCFVRSTFSPFEATLTHLLTVIDPPGESQLRCDPIAVVLNELQCNASVTESINLIEVDFGDGSGPKNITLESTGLGNLKHEYTRTGTYTVSSRTWRLDGEVITGSLAVTILLDIPSFTIRPVDVAEVGVEFDLEIKRNFDADDFGIREIKWQVVRTETNNTVISEKGSAADERKPIRLDQAGTYRAEAIMCNGGSCENCTRSSIITFLAVERISGLSIYLSKNTLPPNGRVWIRPNVEKGSHLQYRYQILPDFPAWFEPEDPTGSLNWAMKSLGQHEIKLQAVNLLGTIENSVFVNVVAAPEISQVVINNLDSEYVLLNSTVRFTVRLSEDSEAVTLYKWSVRDSNDAVIADDATVSDTWSFTVSQYGNHYFNIYATNLNGDSEVYELTIKVLEPIADFEVLPVTKFRTENYVPVDKRFKIETGKSLGNNITYQFLISGVESQSYSGIEDFKSLSISSVGRYNITVKASNRLSEAQKTIFITVVEQVELEAVLLNGESIDIWATIFATVSTELRFQAVSNVAPQNISWELEENSRNFGASFSFESSSEIVEYQLILELFNEAEEKTYYLDVSIQAALVILPYLEYPTARAYYHPSNEEFKRNCQESACIPVFDKRDFLIVYFASNVKISTIDLSLPDLLFQSFRMDRTDGTFSLELSQFTGQYTMEIDFINEVSMISTSKTFMAFDLPVCQNVVICSQAQTENDPVCMIDLINGKPAVELDRMTCRLQLCTFDGVEYHRLRPSMFENTNIVSTWTVNGVTETSADWEYKLRVIDIDGITAGDTISVQASLSDEKGFFNSLLSCQVSTAVEIDVVTPIVFTGGEAQIVVSSNSTETDIIFSNDCVAISVNYAKGNGKQTSYSIRTTDNNWSDTRVSDNQGILFWRAQYESDYAIKATANNTARLYTIPDGKQWNFFTIKPPCKPPKLEHTPLSPIYRSRSVLLEVQVDSKQNQTSQDPIQINPCKFDNMRWTLWKKRPNVSCSQSGTSVHSADDWSQNPDWLPMCRGYADGTEPDEIIDVKDVDRGIARLLLPNWSLRTGEYCFCFNITQNLENDHCSGEPKIVGSWHGDLLNITDSPLLAYLRGATVRIENKGCPTLDRKPLFIDASNSIDPDCVIANPSDYCSEQSILYSWSCQVTTAEMILVEDLTTTCNNLIADAYDVIQDVCRTDFETNQPAMETCNNKAKLKINRGNDFFMEGFNYIFNVSFTTSHKPVEAYDSQVLKFHRPSIGEELAPNIEIKCNSCQSNFHKRVSRTSMVHLTAQPLVINEEDVSCIMNSTSYKYKWTVHQSETEFENCKPASTPVNDDCEEVDINQETSTTGDSSQYLIIKQGILDDNRFYRFTLQIERGGVYRNAGTFILNPNKPPDGGSCEFITQNLGMNGDFRASQSKIEFRCNQWIADERDKPLSYVMRYATLSESPEQCPKRCSTVNPNDVNAGIPTCGLDGNILYKGSQNENIFSYLPLGCQMVCIGIRGETGALKVAEQCEYVAVKEPDNWQLRGIQGLSNLIDQKADPALIFAFAGSFVSILNSKMPPAAPISDASLIPEIPLTPETRLRIRLYVMEVLTYEILKPISLTETRQMASVFLEVVRHPLDFINSTTNHVNLEFYDWTTDISQKLADQITSSTENDYHKQNETLTLAAEDILGGMGHVLEVITNDAVDGSNDRLFKIITQLNDVMYALGRWEVANATPWKLENIKQSKLSIFQSRHFAESLGSECLRALRPINCMSRFNLGFTDIVLPDIPRSAYSDSITTSSELLVTFMTFNPEKIMELDTGTGKKAFDTSLVSFKLWKFANIMVSQSASNDPSDSLREALMSEAIVPLRNLIKPIVIVMPRNKEPTARDIDLGLEPPMLNRHQSCTKTSTLPSATWIRLPPKCARSFLFRSYENAQYIDINIRLATNTTPYDVDKNGVYLTSNGNRRKVEVNCDEEGFCDFENYNVNNDPGVPISQISIENMFETTLVDVKVKTYDIGCSYFNNTDNLWKKNGMAGGIQTSENANRINCTANHTTVFGGETISSPNTIDFDDIDLRPSKNKGAIAMIAGFIGAFAVAAVICRYLDLNDLKYSSTIPHCGPDGPFDYEITIKTGVGWGSGTTANVGIRLYGDQAKSGSRQLGHSNRPFQRGSIEIYQISTLENLGNISKLKIWHDNTGLDPPWFLSRVIVKDLQTKERFYFLVDDWLQIDHNNRLSSVEKEVNHASPEEITLFEEVFRVHRQYQKADSHLWFSIVTRPTRSRYTRLMRLSVASASLFIFTLFTMVWYNLEYRDPKLNLYGFWFDASDIVTGIIASLLTFPISVVLAFLFKRSRSRHSYVHPSRPRTGIEIPLEIEIPNESRPIDLQRDFASSAFSELQSSKKSSEISGDFRKMQLRRGSKFTQESSLTVDASELNSDRSSTNVGSVKTVDSGISSEHLNLVSSRCSKKSLDIKEPMEKELSEDKMEMKPIPFYSADENSQMSSAINHWPVKEHFLDDEIITTDHSSNQCLFPHQTIHLAFFLCMSIMILCSIFIYLYAAEFGPDLTNRWMLSLLICLITSLFILEPIKILFLAVIQSLRRVRKDPCESDNLVEHPTIDKYDVSSSRTFNVNPPQGFALEKARENARKLKRLKQLRTYALTQLIFFIVLCISIANETVGDRLIANNISKSEILEPSFEFANVAIKEDDILRQLNYACDKIERKTNVSKALGGFYTIRKPAREQPSTCLNGIFFGQKIEKTCGFLEEYTNAAICEGEDWVNYLRQSQEIVLLKNTVVLSIGAVSSSAVVVSRVEGQAIYKAHVTSYSAYVKSWKAGVKLSLFLQLILLVHGLYLLLKLVRKIRNSGLHVFSLKAGNLVLLVSLQITSTIVYITKEVLLEESLAIFKDDENATGFYAALQINYIFVVIQSIQLFIVLLSVLSGLRFKRGWHCTNKFVKIFIKSMAIPFLFLLMLMFFFTTAVITVRSWNSSLFDSYTDGFMYMTSLLLRTTERTSGKTEERQSMISFVLMVFFYILGPIIFRGIAKSKGKEPIHDLKFSMARHENFEPQDHELVPFAKKRMRMWLGLQKQKKIRHHVRFEGMITPLSRGSSFCEDFDPVLPENEEIRASPELDEMDDPFFSDSVSAMTKISDASEWTTSRIIEENHSSTGPIEPLHMDYILSKLLNDSIPRLEQQLDQFIDETASLEKLDEILYQLNDKEGSLSSFLTTNSDKPQPTKPEHDQLPSRTKSDPNMKITKRHSKNVFPGMRQTKARAVWGDESNRRPSKITKKD